MYIMIILSMMFFLISNMIMMLSMMISKKMKMNFEKMSPFECGFNPLKLQRMPFSMRFFMITIIFLIFDVEIALILPMVLTLKISNLIMWYMTMILFLMILLMGLFHEWNQGALNWM